MPKAIKSTGAKGAETVGRDLAISALGIWLEDRERLGLVKRERERWVDPNVPDEKIRSGRFIGPSFRPDTVTAHGVETKPPGGFRIPFGIGSSIEIADREVAEAVRRRDLARYEVLSIMVPAMSKLRYSNRTYHEALELYAAGKSLEKIGRELDVSKNLASQYVECGLTWIACCLFWRPTFTRGAKGGSRRRRANAGDLGL